MQHKFKSSNHRLPDAEREQQSVGPVMWRAEQQWLLAAVAAADNVAAVVAEESNFPAHVINNTLVMHSCHTMKYQVTPTQTAWNVNNGYLA